GFGIVLLLVAIFSAKHFLRAGWPLHHANVWLVVASGALFFVAYAFKAWGWQRLFAKHERPTSQALAFAGGAACVTGIALPGRADDAIRIACVRRFPGTRAQFGAIGLSCLVLGMLDNAALTPMASVAAINANSMLVRAGFLVVAVAGVAAAAVVACLPMLARRDRVQRFRAGRWLASHTHHTKETWAAWILVSVSWSLRATAVFLLLNALSLHSSFPLAFAFVCASAASAALPIAPAGAATQAGAGAAILIAAGMHGREALAFSVAAQALIIVTGAAVMMLIAAWQLALRVRPRVQRAFAA
ncbi:MAG TPA: lysylphosphatidylglycerol synthase domain-containing protein, partial [Candidatus Elarobacter sp.]